MGDDDGDGMNTYYVAGKWRGTGIATVPENYYLLWGYWTEEVYVEPDPPEMYINEDGIDCFTAFVLSGEDWEESRVDCPSETRLSGSHGFDNDGDCLALDDGNGNVRALKIVEVDWTKSAGRWKMSEIEGSERILEGDLVLLAMGFLGPESYVVEALDIDFDARSNYSAEHGNFQTSVPGVFATGDCRRGQSLVVWGINEGRGAAREIDRFLMGSTELETP